MSDDFQLIKKGHTKDAYTQEQLKELMLSTDDPIYFIERFIKVQHPTKGSIPLKLYPFQVRMIRAFHENRFVIGLTARQMGKCVSSDTQITKDGNNVKIHSLIKLSFKEKIVNKLEDWLVKLAV